VEDEAAHKTGYGRDPKISFARMCLRARYSDAGFWAYTDAMSALVPTNDLFRSARFQCSLSDSLLARALGVTFDCV